MPNRVPTLVITSPQPKAVVGTAPFTVSGTVTAPGMPEPVDIRAVTVQVDAQPPVRATLKHLPGTQQIQIIFSASMQITGGQDPHTVTVSVASDAGFPVTASVSVSAGLRFEVPAVLLDFALPANIAGNPLGDIASSLQPLMSTVARQINALPLTNQIRASNKIVVGPNLLQTPGATPMLRFGLWILDANFPPKELAPATASFPLPQFTPAAAAGCFALAPPLSPPPVGSEHAVAPASFTILGFALSLPTTTLQLILDILLPQIIAQAASNHFDVNSATLQTNASGTVTVTLSGTLPASISMTAKLEETVGIRQRPYPGSYSTSMPAVISSSSSASVGDLLQWIAGILFPGIGLYLLTLFGLANYGVDEGASTATGILSGFLSALPAWIPFRDSSVPSAIRSSFPFPMAVLNFDSFGTTDTAIVGAGSIGIAARDQTMVSVSVTGPSDYPNYSYGIEGAYTASLIAFEPDNDQMVAQVSGTPKKITFGTDPFFQQGGFATDLPLPAKPSPGKYPFTISVNATETCASDPSRKLTGSASKAVTATVVKGVQPEIKSASSVETVQRLSSAS